MKLTPKQHNQIVQLYQLGLSLDNPTPYQFQVLSYFQTMLSSSRSKLTKQDLKLARETFKNP